MTSAPAEQLLELAGPALIGTDRAEGSAPALLNRAAALGARRRAGVKPAPVEHAWPMCPPDASPVANSAQTAALRRLIADPDAGLITEWAELAAASGVRVSDELVPDLLHWWARQQAPAEIVYRATGRRGEWLASLNPSWRKSAAKVDIPENTDEIWKKGTAAERAALLVLIRKNEPARALALVQEAWQHDSADERRRFIEALSESRSMADEPFLESALDDRSKSVRRQAASVLRRIDGSRLRARMTERARSIIGTPTKGGVLRRGARIVLTPPAEFDPSWERDGIEEQPPQGTGTRAWWLRQILAAADVTVWTEATGLDPDAVLAALRADEYHRDAIAALAGATSVRPDADWCSALARTVLESENPNTTALVALMEELSKDRREALVLELCRHKRLTMPDRWALIGASPHPWSVPFSRQAMTLLHNRKPLDKADAWRLHQSVESVSRAIAPTEAEQFEQAVRSLFSEDLTDNFRKSIDRAHFRAEMHKEFAT